MSKKIIKQRKPDIKIDGFSIWIIRREFPSSSDSWDVNWLDVFARCKTENSEVWAEGSIIHASELLCWLSEIKELNEKLSGTASLECIEPNLHAEVKMQSKGRAVLTVNITPDHLLEKHEFIFEIDQSYFALLISDVENVMNKYEVKGTKVGI